jgi:hypothetical protein
MKNEFWVIEGVVNGGFWDSEFCQFRGFMFATYYQSEDCEEINKDIKIAWKNPCKKTKIYYES